MIQLNRAEKIMSRPMVPVVAALILGIVSAKHFGGNLTPTLIVSGVAAVLGGVFTFMLSPGGVRRTAFLTVWLMLPGVTWLGYARTMEADIPTPLKSRLEHFEDAVVTGTIDYISLRQDGYAITVAASNAQIGQFSYKADKLIITTEYHAEDDFHIGDFVRALGKLYPCEPAANPGQFDSEMYYRIRGVDGRLFSDSVHVYGRDTGLSYRVNDAMYQIRKRLSEGIFTVLPAIEAGTLNAILTGDRGMLDEDVKDMYSEGGIAHILSISSLHITLLGMGLFRLLMRTVQRLKISVAVTLAVMFLYGLMTGFSVSTCRAILMLAVSLVGKLLWRGYDLPSSIGLNAFVLLVKQPNYLYDSGFRLSFLAVVGIYAASRLADALEVESDIVKSLIMSAAIQVFTIPVVMNSYFYISPYSILVNILVLPLMSILLVAGFSAGGIGCTPAVIVGRIVAGPVYYILKLYEKICELEAVLPYSRLMTGAPDSVMVAVYYAAVVVGWGGCVEGLRKKVEDKGKRRKGKGKRQKDKEERQKDKEERLIGKEERQKGEEKRQKYNEERKCKTDRLNEKHNENKRSVLYLLITVVGFAGLFVHPGRPDVYCAFLDVGQGDSIYIEAEGMHIMVDSGSTSVKSVGKYRVMPFLKYRGVTELDCVVISHPDTDHVSGVIEMLEEGYPKIGEIVVGTNVSDYEKIVEAASGVGVRVRRVGAGENLWSEEETDVEEEKTKEKNKLNGVFLQGKVISPEQKILYADANSGSVVLELIYGDFSLLLTGDSDFTAEEMYCGRLSERSYTVLKCAHHGSKYSTSFDMLGRVRPVITVISCSKYNTYGHPNPNLLDRLEIMDSEVFTTPECGMVSVEYNGNGNVRVKKFIETSDRPRDMRIVTKLIESVLGLE